MKIGIYGQFYHKDSEKYIRYILDAFQKKEVEIVIEEHFLNNIRKHKAISDRYVDMNTFTELDSSYDLFVSIGGDGTILKSVTFVADLRIPIIGINTGTLGFLSTIPKEKIADCMNQILSGGYSISERNLLSVYTNSSSEPLFPLNFALNEVAVNRKNTTSMIKIETRIDGELLTSYWSDGLIVSTPTGSTGYSLSCGGPIIDPKTESLVITPIAPHNLTVRPLIIPNNCEISLTVSGRGKSFLVSLDSRIATVKNKTTIRIKKAPFKIRLVQLTEDSFLKTLREKLLWGEDKRN